MIHNQIMKQAHLLYICSKEEPSIVKALSSRYSVHLHYVGMDKEWENLFWDVVIFQDADAWQTCFFQKLKKFPWLFLSTRRDIRGYISPKANLFGVINMGGADLSLWGIPQELQLRLQPPAEKKGNYYYFEPQPETCRIVYCPTGNSVYENDFKLLSFLQLTNAALTIVSDQYQALADSFPYVRIVSRKSWLPVFKKAHLVVASGHDAICAMALCKPCVVLGDCGLGGMVTPTNYEQLQSVYFSGRKGASVGEMVPADLLEAEFFKVLGFDYKEDMQILQKKVWQTYGWGKFSTLLFKEIDRIMNLSVAMSSKEKRLALKPFLSSVFRQEIFKGKRYMMRGMLCIGELDEEMAGLLEQCDGTTSIRELMKKNGYDSKVASILWGNLYELWKEKLILFKL